MPTPSHSPSERNDQCDLNQTSEPQSPTNPHNPNQLNKPSKPYTPIELNTPTAPPKLAPRSRDPLHGVTLEMIVTRMVKRHGWEGLADRIPIRCFQFEPTIKSSLAFLRKTPWARQKLEDWYAYDARRFDMQ